MHPRQDGSDFPWGLQFYPVLRFPFELVDFPPRREVGGFRREGGHPRVGIYRQRTEENVLKDQLVNFHRLTPKADFILIPFLCQQEIADVAVLDPVSAHVELIQRDNIFRVVIADIVIRAELTLNGLIGCQQIGNLNI